MMFFDMEYLIIMAPVFIFSLGAQWMVKSRYKKFAQYSLSSGQTGAEIARQILRANRINDVAVEETGGWLSDHYSPTELRCCGCRLMCTTAVRSPAQASLPTKPDTPSSTPPATPS